MDKKSKRIEVLLDWRKSAIGRGHKVPSESDLTKIGAAGELWPPHIDTATAEPWRATIAFLLKQVWFGVVDPVDNMPDDLFDPTPIPSGGEPMTSPNPTSAPNEDPRLVALRNWRTATMSRNTTLAGLKDSALRLIVSSNSRTPEDITAHLPVSWHRFALEIADVIAEVSPAPSRTEPTVPQLEHSAQPASQTASHSAPTAPVPRRGPGLAGLHFAAYNLVPSDHPVVQARSTPTGTGGVVHSWPAYESPGAVVYRVVASDDYSPYSPDDADEIAVTTELTCTDERPYTAAVRYVQVWCHVGPTPEQAAAAQPVPHASAAVVAPVQELSISEDEGKVIGYWTVLKGAARVQVHRIPVEQAERVLRRGTPDAQFRIFPTEANLNGFVDAGAERGRRYLYQMWVEAETGGGALLSMPSAQRIEVSAVLAPVTDLRVTPSPDQDGFDLVWTAPPGSAVAIFRTEQAPDAGAGAATLADVSALKSAGLPDDARLRHPSELQRDGRSRMANVSWPRDWTRAYFTPVTMLGGQVRLGPSAPAVRIRPILDLKVVERTHQQVVTFAWPDGATSVFAFIGPPRHGFAAARGSRSFEITRKQYVRQGGLHLVNTLPPAGCAIHLLPVAYSKGDRIEGTPATIHYPGLLRLSYHVARQRSSVVIRVVAEHTVTWQIPFALVHNPTRFPLAINDGTALNVVPAGQGAQGGYRLVPPRLTTQAGEIFWTASVQGLSGYVRLFVDLGENPQGPTVALLDPPIATLRLGNGPGR